jgi:thioredoxin reductase
VDDAASEQYDVVVVGGGAAGLSAALVLGRALRTVLVVDAGVPRHAPAGHVHNYLGREGTPPGALLAVGRAEVAGYGGQVVTGMVSSARPLSGRDDATGFRVELVGGREVLARRLLVATGLVDELPDIPGIAELWGRDVLHCAYCHAWEFRDKAIGALATSPLALHQALLFRHWSADVSLFTHTSPALGQEACEQLAARGIRLVAGEVAALEAIDGRLNGVRLRSGELVPRQAVLVMPRYRARADVLAPLGLRPTEQLVGGQVIGSYLSAAPTGATSVPGVWVAGNVADPGAGVVNAAAAGLNTAVAINADLIEEDTNAPSPPHRAHPGVFSNGAQIWI